MSLVPLSCNRYGYNPIVSDNNPSSKRYRTFKGSLEIRFDCKRAPINMCAVLFERKRGVGLRALRSVWFIDVLTMSKLGAMISAER